MKRGDQQVAAGRRPSCCRSKLKLLLVLAGKCEYLEKTKVNLSPPNLLGNIYINIQKMKSPNARTEALICRYRESMSDCDTLPCHAAYARWRAVAPTMLLHLKKPYHDARQTVGDYCAALHKTDPCDLIFAVIQQLATSSLECRALPPQADVYPLDLTRFQENIRPRTVTYLQCMINHTLCSCNGK